VLALSLTVFDLGCVKTHTSSKCRKYDSLSQYRSVSAQYDSALMIGNCAGIFYALGDCRSFRTAKSHSGHSRSLGRHASFWSWAIFACRVMKAEPKPPAFGEDAANDCISLIRLCYESVDQLVSMNLQSDGIRERQRRTLARWVPPLNHGGVIALSRQDGHLDFCWL
jgi:hypothetical protein